MLFRGAKLSQIGYISIHHAEGLNFIAMTSIHFPVFTRKKTHAKVTYIASLQNKVQCNYTYPCRLT